MNLKKDYNKANKNNCKSEPVTALQDLSFSLNAGEVFALVGVNGSGKSTTFKAIT